MRRRSILVLTAILFVFAEQSRSDLVQIGSSVYRTGSGASSLYWYMDMGGLVNKSWYSQQIYASSIKSNVEGIQDSWHIASQQEIDQLLVFGGQHDIQNSLVASTIGMHEGEQPYATHARYNNTWTVGGTTNHYATKLWPTSGDSDWVASDQSGVWDSDLSPDIGAWVVTQSSPYFRADAGGPYRINVGETIQLNSSGSYSNCGIEEIRWQIGNQEINSSISYDQLNLSPGTYQIKLQVGGAGVYDYAYTSIEIIPEPATLLLLGLGGLILKRRT